MDESIILQEVNDLAWELILILLSSEPSSFDWCHQLCFQRSYNYYCSCTSVWDRSRGSPQHLSLWLAHTHTIIFGVSWNDLKSDKEGSYKTSTRCSARCYAVYARNKATCSRRPTGNHYKDAVVFNPDFVISRFIALMHVSFWTACMSRKSAAPTSLRLKRKTAAPFRSIRENGSSRKQTNANSLGFRVRLWSFGN